MSNLFGIETRNITIAINDDDGVPSGMTVEVCPPDNPRVLRAERKIKDLIAAGSRNKKVDYEEIIHLRLAAHIVGWSFADNAQWNGNAIPGVEYSEANCAALLKDVNLKAIANQVAEAIEDRARFSRRADGSAD